MDNTPVNATVTVTSPAVATGSVSPLSSAAPAPEKKARQPRFLRWSKFFQPRDWKRDASGQPEEIKVKQTQTKEDGTEEEILVGTGNCRLVNQQLPGDTILDGNGDSYMVLPDMSIRAISKYHRREERKARREAQKAKLRELREAARQSGGLLRSKRVLLSP